MNMTVSEQPCSIHDGQLEKESGAVIKKQSYPRENTGPCTKSCFLLTEFFWLGISPGSMPNPELLQMPRVPSDLFCPHKGQVEKPFSLQSKPDETYLVMRRLLSDKEVKF